jgi:hypothetical protein
MVLDIYATVVENMGRANFRLQKDSVSVRTE